MSNPDFLSQNQPTEHNVRALWYLHQFHAKQPFTNGLAYEDLLQKCRLDYTLDSLHRIDKLLDYIREKEQPNRDDFLRNPANQQFLFILAFYLGEVRGRLARIAPMWKNYADFIAENPALESVFGYCFEYEFVAIFMRENDVYQHFPLVAILERLFPEFDEPEKSVYFSTVTGDYQKLSPNEPLPQIAQSLPIDVQAALKNTSAHWQHYWQILPPKWMLGDDLMAQIQAVPQLYQKGRVVWAALVQANSKLFEHNHSASCPAEIIYDKSGRTPPEILHEWATELGQLKHTTPNDPELARYAKHITNEHTRFSGSIPISISRGMPVFGATIFVWRLHLPDAKLSLPIMPILIDEGDEVMILPAKLWQNTHFYQRWLDVGKRNMDNGISQEILAAWANLSADEAEHFWQDYPELVVPQMEELPPFAQSIDDNPPTISSEDARFLNRCQTQAQQEYRRWHEFHHLTNDDETSVKLRLPENLYKQLRTLNPAPFLDDLNREINVPRLSNAKPLPKVAATLSQNLSPLQTAKLVQFLHTHGITSLSKVSQNERQVGDPERPSSINTTATLALAFMYLTGKNVPQSIEEGIGWLNYAADLGDSRALRWQAELVLRAPEITSKLFEQQLLKDFLPLSVHLTNQGNISVLTIKEAEKSYPKERGAQLALVRKCLEMAWQAGDTIAPTRLQTLIANGTLPQRDEKRFTHIQFWVADYLENKGIDIRDVFAKPKKEQSELAKNALHAYRMKKQNEQHQYDESDDKPAWHKWAKWAVALVVIFSIRTCVSDWRANESKPTPVAEPTVSGSLKTQTTPTAEPATTVNSQKAKTIANDTVSLSDAVFALQQKLPQTTFTGYHEIESVLLDNQSVIVKIKDQNRGMMNIQAANSLYCREPLFDGLRMAKAVVIFDVQAKDDLRYDMNVHCE